MREKGHTLFILSLLYVLLAFQLIPTSSIQIGVHRTYTGSTAELNLDYFVEHDPVLINSNQDFEDVSSSGTGVQEDPYVIEKLHIVATGSLNAAVEVRGTTTYFVIRDCSVVSDYIGILIADVQENTASIINNTCISNSGDGGGVGVSSSENCTIVENRCSNFMQGIHLNQASGCLIQNNNISDNNYQGINIRYSSWNVITGNIVENSTEHGLAIVGTARNNVVHHNRFIDNGNVETYRIDGEREGDLTSQGYDEGSNNVWYDSMAEIGNFWSDYSGTGPYLIDGSADTVDLYPDGRQDQPESLGLDFVQIVLAGSVVGCLVIILVWRFSRR